MFLFNNCLQINLEIGVIGEECHLNRLWFLRLYCSGMTYLIRCSLEVKSMFIRCSFDVHSMYIWWSFDVCLLLCCIQLLNLFLSQSLRKLFNLFCRTRWAWRGTRSTWTWQADPILLPGSGSWTSPTTRSTSPGRLGLMEGFSSHLKSGNDLDCIENIYLKLFETWRLMKSEVYEFLPKKLKLLLLKTTLTFSIRSFPIRSFSSKSISIRSFPITVDHFKLL